MNTKTDMISRQAVASILKKALSDQQALHDNELTALRREIEAQRQHPAQASGDAYNNRPRQKRNALWQRQLAALQEAAQQQALKTWGQNAVGNHLREKGIGCNNKTAADLVAMLVTDGFLIRKPNGKATYPAQQRAA